MISQIIVKNDDRQWDNLPSGWVCFALRNRSAYLYIGFSVRLSARLRRMWDNSLEDRLLQELCEDAEVLEYQKLPDAMTAMVMQKALIQEHHPSYQQRLRPWKNYVYLGLDSNRFPFISIQEHTNDDWQYLGPFRSRFFLADVIDSISRILKLPNCDSGTYPCSKFDSDICRGWCLALAPAQESAQEHNLEKLDILLQESFVHPNNGIMEMVQQERDRNFDALEFAKADLLDDEIRLLKAYREWLNFLYVAKSISFDSPQLTIEHGQLISAKLNGKTYHFPTDNLPYRENELLALPLTAVDEMKIIYDYIRERAHA